MRKQILLVVSALAALSARSAYAQPPPDQPPPTPPAPVEPPASAPAAAPPAAQPTPPPQQVEPPPPAASATPPAEGGADEHGPGAKDGYPLAGWHNGVFYLRDVNDNFRLYIQGRAQIDAYTYFGPGVSDSALKPTMLLRRIRPELTGEVLGHWQWMLAGDFGVTSIDNGKGTNETSAAGPGKAPDAASGRYAGAQTPSVKAGPTDVFLNYKLVSEFNVQIGQYDAPFMMENRTSDKYFSFMERSLAVRDVGIPTNKEIGIMAWGETQKKHFAYALGGFMGDGQNRLNVDSRFDVLGRVFAHPLATSADAPLKDLQVGASFRFGTRDPKNVFYDYAAMSTQGNYTFWSSTYTSSKGPTHIIPANSQTGVAGELRVPVSIVDLQSELVYISNGTREAVEGFQATNTERFGDLSGYSYYVQFGVWPLGNRDINGAPGYENPTHVDFSKPDKPVPAQALQLLVRWEQLALKYSSNSKSGDLDAKNVDGDIKVNVFELGANYWFTKHIRLSANYLVNMFPDSEPVSPTKAGGPQQTSSNRALAPGNTLATGVNDDARDSAHVLHELLFRVALAL